MDVLSDVLRAVRLNGAVFFDVRVAEPLVAETPNMDRIRHMVMPNIEHVIPFHIMLRGSCWVESLESPDPPAEFREGDIVIYPQGHSHVFATNVGDRMPPDLENYRRRPRETMPFVMHLDEHGPTTMRFVCGYLGCRATPFNPLLEALPSQLIARRPEKGNHIEVDLIQAAVEETENTRAGRETMLARLSELLFVRVLRRYIEQMPDHSQGWLAALKDPCISKALQLIHGDPAHDWTLGELARQCGLSRASFAEKFAGCMGETPMRYLGRWRMQLAARMLEAGARSIEDVAEAVGYRSESAFNRAFKNIVGTPPGIWRRTQGNSDGAAALQK